MGARKRTPIDQLPNRLRYWRKRRNIAPAEVARAIGCKPKQLYNLELGNRKGGKLKVEQLDRLAALFRCTVAELLPAGPTLDDPDRDLLRSFRALPDYQQAAVRELIRGLGAPRAVTASAAA